jgi:hypothetical protein
MYVRFASRCGGVLARLDRVRCERGPTLTELERRLQVEESGDMCRDTLAGTLRRWGLNYTYVDGLDCRRLENFGIIVTRSRTHVMISDTPYFIREKVERKCAVYHTWPANSRHFSSLVPFLSYHSPILSADPRQSSTQPQSAPRQCCSSCSSSSRHSTCPRQAPSPA